MQAENNLKVFVKEDGFDGQNIDGFALTPCSCEWACDVERQRERGREGKERERERGRRQKLSLRHPISECPLSESGADVDF